MIIFEVEVEVEVKVKVEVKVEVEVVKVEVEETRLSKIDKTRFKRLLNCSIVAIA